MSAFAVFVNHGRGWEQEADAHALLSDAMAAAGAARHHYPSFVSVCIARIDILEVLIRAEEEE